MSSRQSDEAMERSLALVAEVANQTDRGVAIVGIAWVEEALMAAIYSFLEKDKSSWERLFRKSGPLSSLSAKIDIARLLGIMSSEIAADLHRLRDIRNEFAHSVLNKDNTPLSFSTMRIKDKCLALRCVKREKIRDPRKAFIRACAVLNADFTMVEFLGQQVSGSGRVVVSDG